MAEEAADADIGFGTKFLRGGITLPTAYTPVGQIIELALPELSRDTFEKTHYESPKQFKEFGGALFDAGEFTVTVQFSSITAMTETLADFTGRDGIPYRMEWPDLTQWDFTGVITGVAAASPMADRLTCAVTIKLTGVPAFLDV